MELQLMNEAAIRADERAKVVAELETYANLYVDHWGPIVGWDDAKATGWNISVAARGLLPKQPSANAEGK
jgi:hypothetical protein